MTDVLEHSTHILQVVCCLLSQQQVLNLAQRAILSVIDKVVPSTRITIQHGGSLDDLFAVLFPTPLAFECVVCIAASLGLELE